MLANNIEIFLKEKNSKLVNMLLNNIKNVSKRKKTKVAIYLRTI